MAVDQDSLYVTEHEKEVVNEFCYLLEKSRQLFNGLRRVEFLYPTMPKCITKFYVDNSFNVYGFGVKKCRGFVDFDYSHVLIYCKCEAGGVLLTHCKIALGPT
ncbi:conserved hypothetical protein [Trichinella spiralis]|uniref:hypothetical protein n=1 Tax=Trichinella spiralis TaxID=6334 RepID=UPI0001EFC519|nr:conserved hypothetical protein [Trichinella spiralis]